MPTVKEYLVELSSRARAGHIIRSLSVLRTAITSSRSSRLRRSLRTLHSRGPNGIYPNTTALARNLSDLTPAGSNLTSCVIRMVAGSQLARKS